MIRNSLIRTAQIIVGSALLAVTFSACRDGDRPDPNPNPTPKPIVHEVKVTPNLIGGLVVDNEFKDFTNLEENTALLLWGHGEKMKSAIEVPMKLTEGKWIFYDKTDPTKLEQAQYFVAMIGGESSEVKMKQQSYSFNPTSKENHIVGDCVISQFYHDVLVGKAAKGKDNTNISLKSPFKRLKLTIANSQWAQVISGISIQIDGALANASFDGENWSGTPTPITVTLKDKEKWNGSEEVTLWLPLPTTNNELTLHLSFTNDKGEQSIDASVELAEGVSEVTLTLPEIEIENPPLAFAPPIDTDYWKRANQDAYNLITSNFAGKVDEVTARALGWSQIRPLVDEIMRSKTLYRNDMNMVDWLIDQKENEESDKRDWGYAIGLETLDGTLVEVYPPQYDTYSGGGERGRGYFGYYYTTVPEGEYRLVAFVSYPESWVGAENSEKWYQLPMLDALSGYECLNGDPEYYERYLEPVPMEKSPYLGIDIIEVKDRETNHLIAPRWYMGRVYADKQDYKNGDYINKGEMPIHYYAPGNIVEVTAVNTTNQTLRGTVVAKVEFLPMFNPIGQWRLDQTAAHSSVGGVFGRSGDWYSTRWSKEIGKSGVSILPNSEDRVAVEILQVDYNWQTIAGRGHARLGPATSIHFYWVDEEGNETMMMKMDYPMMNRMQQKNYGEVRNKNLNWHDHGLLSQDIMEDPTIAWTANGFFFSN